MPEVALEAVLLRPGNDRFNVAEALDQLHRFSLVERLSAEEDGHVLVGRSACSVNLWTRQAGGECISCIDRGRPKSFNGIWSR